MGNKSEILPWDYFLTTYERDLLQLPFEEALRKYPRLTREQALSDLIELQDSQDRIKQVNGQN